MSDIKELKTATPQPDNLIKYLNVLPDCFSHLQIVYIRNSTLFPTVQRTVSCLNAVKYNYSVLSCIMHFYAGCHMKS